MPCGTLCPFGLYQDMLYKLRSVKITIPEFLRPMATKGIEKFARERGYAEVTEAVLHEARAHYGM